MTHPFVFLTEPAGADWRGTPTMVCPCGNDMLAIVARFDRYTRLPAFYLLDGACACCGALLTLPTPIDDTEGIDDLR